MTEAGDAATLWRARLAAALAEPAGDRARAAFEEINPHLVGDPRFAARWGRPRKAAAVLAPVVDRADGPTLLFTVRAADMPSHAGQICFPGGGLRPGETADAAALREAQEEVGLAETDARILGALGVHKGGLGYAVTPVVAVVSGTAAFSPCPREVADIFETPLEFALDPANHEIERRSHEGVDYFMYALAWRGRRIWGLTASILRSLAEAYTATATATAAGAGAPARPCEPPAAPISDEARRRAGAA